jgi:CBS domain-containing protein
MFALRLRVQLRAMQRGVPVSNRTTLPELTPVERSRLKEAFRAVKAWQSAAAQHYQVSDR